MCLWYMKCFIYRTADVKPSELWSRGYDMCLSKLNIIKIEQNFRSLFYHDSIIKIFCSREQSAFIEWTSKEKKKQFTGAKFHFSENKIGVAVRGTLRYHVSLVGQISLELITETDISAYSPLFLIANAGQTVNGKWYCFARYFWVEGTA